MSDTSLNTPTNPRRGSVSNSSAAPSGIPSLRSLRSLLPFGPSKNTTPSRTPSKASTKSPTKDGSFYHSKSMSMSIGASPQPPQASTPSRGALSSFTRKASATASLGKDRKGSLSKDATPGRASLAWDARMSASLPSRDRSKQTSALPVISIHRNFSDGSDDAIDLEKELNTPLHGLGGRKLSSLSSRLEKPLPREPGGSSPAPSTQQLDLDIAADTLAPLMNEEPPILRTPSPTAPMDLSTIIEAETSGAIDPDSSGVSISKHIPAESAPTSPDSPYRESLLHSPHPHLSSASHSPISRQASSLIPSTSQSRSSSVAPSSDAHEADTSGFELSTSDVHTQVVDALRRTSCGFTGYPPVVVDEPTDDSFPSQADNSILRGVEDNNNSITLIAPRPLSHASRSRSTSIISPPRTPLQQHRDTDVLDSGLSPRTITTSDFSPATSTVEYYARRGPPPPLPLSEKPIIPASLPPSVRPSPSHSPVLPSPTRTVPPSRNVSPSAASPRSSYFVGQPSPSALHSTRSSPRLQPSPLQPSALSSQAAAQLTPLSRRGSSSPRLRPSVHNVFWDEVTSRHRSQSSVESGGYTPRASLESSRFSSARPSLDRGVYGRGASYGHMRPSLDAARHSETSLDHPSQLRAHPSLDLYESNRSPDLNTLSPDFMRTRKRSLSVDQGNQTPVRPSTSTRPSTAMSGSVGRRLGPDNNLLRRPETSSGSARSATSLSGRSGTSLSGSFSRRADPLRTPGPGPRTLNAFRAAGVLDEDDPLASAKSRSSEDVLEKSRTALERSANVLDRVRSPSVSHGRSGPGMGSVRGKFAPGARLPSDMTERRVSGRKASWSTSVGATSPGPQLTDSPTFTFSTPRSASTAPTSVSGGSHDEELREMQARHADEMAALLGALGDAQRSARLLRGENNELRERADELADEVERLHAERARHTELVTRMEEQVEFVQKERDDMRSAVEEMAGEMERMRDESEVWAREREEDRRERERLRKKLAETSVALRMAEVRARLGSTGQDGAGNVTLTTAGLSHATSSTLLNGSVKGFGSEANDSLHSSPLLLMGSGGSPLRDTSPLHLRAGSVDWEGESDVGERTRRFANSHSRSGSSSNGRLRTSRRLSGASSVFPTLPANMSMIFSEDDGAWAGSQGYGSGSIEQDHGRRDVFNGPERHDVVEEPEREGSPTIAVPLTWGEVPEAAKWAEEEVHEDGRRGRSRASSRSSANDSPSPRTGSPGSLFLRPEDEQHLGDMESFDLSAGRMELDVVDEEL